MMPLSLQQLKRLEHLIMTINHQYKYQSTTQVNLELQYRSVPTENLITHLKHSNGPIQPILTLRKKKMYLPTLKPVVKEQL